MKKLNFLKIILSLLLVSSMVLTLFSCEYNISPNDETKTDSAETKATDVYTDSTTISLEELYGNVKDYQIIKTENGYRLIFDDPSIYEKYGDNCGIVGFGIESWEGFNQRLLNGNLTFREKENIYYTFCKDEYGFVISNPYISSYKFSHPIADQIEYITFYDGSPHSAKFIFEQYSTVRLNVSEPTHEYTQWIDSWFLNLEQKEKCIEYEKELPNGNNLICYNKTITDYSTQYTEEYILSDGVKKVLIHKIYIDYTSDIPLSIELYAITKNNLYLDTVSV